MLRAMCSFELNGLPGVKLDEHMHIIGRILAWHFNYIENVSHGTFSRRSNNR